MEETICAPFWVLVGVLGVQPCFVVSSVSAAMVEKERETWWLLEVEQTSRQSWAKIKA
jgi:hypothetical protein